MPPLQRQASPSPFTPFVLLSAPSDVTVGAMRHPVSPSLLAGDLDLLPRWGPTPSIADGLEDFSDFPVNDSGSQCGGSSAMRRHAPKASMVASYDLRSETSFLLPTNAPFWPLILMQTPLWRCQNHLSLLHPIIFPTHGVLRSKMDHYTSPRTNLSCLTPSSPLRQHFRLFSSLSPLLRIVSSHCIASTTVAST